MVNTSHYVFASVRMFSIMYSTVHFILQSMGAKDKKRFEDMAEKDKQRYNKEMANWDGEGAGGKRKKQKKDPNAPKRAL